MAAVVAGWLAGCAAPATDGTPPAKPAAPTAPPAAPAPPPPPEPAPAPARAASEPPAPASPAAAQQAQRIALAATEMLELGQEDQALVEIERALQSDPANRLAQSLLKQIRTDPQELLGREFFPYRVEPGESLSLIAGRFLKDVHLFYALARYNDIKVPRQLLGGQMIKIPGKQPPPAAAQPAAPPSARPAPAPASAPASAAAQVRPAPAPASAEDRRAANEAVVRQEYRRGLELMAQQKPSEAIEAFDKVLEREPGHANAKLKRAQALNQVAGLIRLLENTIRRLDGQLAKDPGNAAAREQRDKAVAARERLLSVK